MTDTPTDIVTAEPEPTYKSELAVYETPAASPLEQWARDMAQAYFIAERLVRTSFVPRSYSGRPAEAAAAIMTGQEVGLSPVASLRSIDIIDQVPAMRAIAMRALVQSKGHEIWVHESTATRCIVRGRRRGEETLQESVWTVERARALNLLGKSNWKNQPIAMLLARATSELARLIAADVLLGIPYSIEELEDLGESKPADESPAKPRATSRAQRKPLVEEPVLTDVEAPPADPAPLEDEPPLDDTAEMEAARARAAAAFADQPVLDAPPVDFDAP